MSIHEDESPCPPASGGPTPEGAAAVAAREPLSKLAAGLRVIALKLGKAIHDLLFGFSPLDGVYFVVLFTFGSYFIVDAPIHFGLFVLYLYLVRSPRPLAQAFSLFVTLALLFSLVLTGLMIDLWPRVSAPSIHTRVIHQISARYFLLVAMPFMIHHVRSQTAHLSLPVRWNAKLSWTVIKASFWLGAIPALLTIRGELAPLHAKLVLAALPLVGLHIALAWRAPRADRPPPEPFSIRARIGPRMTMAAAAIAVVVSIAGVVHPGDTILQNYDDPSYMVAGEDAVFEPSPAGTRGDVYYHAEYLGGSNRCATDPCHPEVFRQWSDSPHRAATNTLYLAEVKLLAMREGVEQTRRCAGCHDPISLISGAIAPGLELHAPEGRREGISCMICHSTDGTGVGHGGSLQLRFPEHFYLDDLGLTALVGAWREHAIDMRPAGLTDQLCASCHHLGEVADWGGEQGARILRDHHGQQAMRPICRQPEAACVSCHMPDLGISEKPGRYISVHGFDRTLEAIPIAAQRAEAKP